MLLNLRFVSGTIVRLEISATKTIADVKRELLSRFPDLNPATLKLIAFSSILPDAMQLADLYFQPDDFIIVQPLSKLRTRAQPPPLRPATHDDDAKIQSLIADGFSASDSEMALARTRGDVRQAAEMIRARKISLDSNEAERVRSIISLSPWCVDLVMAAVKWKGDPELMDVLTSRGVPGFFEYLRLNPSDFNCQSIAKKLADQKPTQAPPPELPRQETAMDRLMAMAGGFNRDLVRAILDSLDGNEEEARRCLLEMQNQ
jgi:SOS response regulatory protein OraA/RecX